MQRRLITLLLLLLVPLCTMAQPWPSLTASDGLSGMSVFRIAKDSLQQTWIGTSNGVTLFNGQTTWRFPIASNDDASVYCLDIAFLGPDRRAVVATEQGVYAFSSASGGFERILSDVERAEVLLAIGDTLYVGGADGLARSTDGGATSHVLLSLTLNSLDNSVRGIRRSADGDVWFTTAHQLNRLHRSTDQIEPLFTDKSIALSNFALADGKAFVGTKNNGAVVFDLTTRQLTPLHGIDKIVTDVEYAGSHLIYIATDGDGAYVVDTRSLAIVAHYSTAAEGQYRIKSDAVYCFMHDEQGTDWLGFYRNGLSYLSQGDLQLDTYRQGDGFTTDGMNVTAMMKQGDTLIIGSDKGVFVVDDGQGCLRTLSAEQTGRRIVSRLLRYGDYFYICYYDGGIERLHQRTLQTAGPPTSHSSFRSGAFTEACVSPAGELWLSNNDGIWTVGPDGQLTNYTEQNSRIYGNAASSIGFDHEGNGWLAFPDGIVRYAQENRSFSTDAFPKGFFNKGKNLQFRNVHDSLLIAFGQHAIYVTTADMSTFGTLPLPPTILSELCVDLVDDGLGHYWIATESGLFRTDYTMGRIEQVPLGHGLSGYHVNRLFVDDDHQLWVATQNGLLKYRTDNASAAVNLLVNDMTVGDEKATATDLLRVNSERTINLHWNLASQMLRLNLTATDYHSQQQHFFEYAIDDNEAMTMVSGADDIVLEGLSPGRHTLSVQLVGDSTTRRTYTIMVKPTNFFYGGVLFFLLLLTLLYLWWRYRKRTQSIIAEHIETEQAFIDQSQEQWREETEEKKEKYAKVRVDEQELKQIYERMDHYFKTEQPYLNPEFRLKDIAQVLDVSSSVLSQVFTLYAKESYYDYVNRHRLEVFKQMIAEGRHHQLTIAALSEQCGFKRSSFFSTFRKMEGITPYEFIKKNGKN